MEVDPARVRELGGKMRATAGTVRQLAPLSNGVDSIAGAVGGELVVSLRDAARALNEVVEYHAKTYDTYAKLCVTAADTYEAADRAGAGEIEGGSRPGAGSPAGVPATPGG